MTAALVQPSPTMLYPPPSYPLDASRASTSPTKTATAETSPTVTASTTPPPGGLASTGPSGWLISAAGLALVVFGLVLLQVVRRNRRR